MEQNKAEQLAAAIASAEMAAGELTYTEQQHTELTNLLTPVMADFSSWATTTQVENMVGEAYCGIQSVLEQGWPAREQALFYAILGAMTMYQQMRGE
jgi:hypothetical protein